MTEDRIEKFTPSQEEALKRFDAFRKAPITKDVNSRVFVLIGPAGSGKSTIVKYAFEDLIQKDLNLDKDSGSYDLWHNPQIIGVALAHKAKGNLAKSIHVCKTFASYFGMKETHGPEGQRYFETDPYLLKLALCKAPAKVVVHDEVSMYDIEMIKTVLEHTNPHTKIVLMGDAAQLPPINTEGDEDSPAFVMFDNIFELKERVRQTEGNPILQLSDILREEIRGSQNIGRVMEALKIDNVVDGKGHQLLSYRDFLPHYKGITSNYMQAKVIAYRRATVDKFNLTIRNYIHGKPDSPFIPGEIVYMNETYYYDEEGAQVNTIGDFENNSNPNRKYFCYNSDEYLIDDVQKGTLEDIEVLKIFINTENRPDLKDIDGVFFPVVAPGGVAKYSEVFFSRKRRALTAQPHEKKSKWKYFYDFKNKFGDCSYAYALTGHKAQGSGYQYVYVDVNDILTVGPISPKRKLQAIYTAMTRATDLVMFLKSN